MKLQVLFDSKALLKKLREMPGALQATFSQGLDDLGNQVVRRARRKAPKDRGTMANSITMEKTGPLERRIGPSVGGAGRGDGHSYPSDVEFGTKPHWAPFQPILMWVWRHRAKFGATTKSGRAATGVKAGLQVERAAYAVQRAIAKRGTKAQPFLHPAFDEVIQRATDVLSRYGRQVLKRLGGE